MSMEACGHGWARLGLISLHCLYDFGQCPCGWNGTIELSPSMIGDNDGLCSVFDGFSGIILSEYTFYDDW